MAKFSRRKLLKLGTFNAAALGLTASSALGQDKARSLEKTQVEFDLSHHLLTANNTSYADTPQIASEGTMAWTVWISRKTNGLDSVCVNEYDESWYAEKPLTKDGNYDSHTLA